MRRHISNMSWTIFEGLSSAIVNIVVLSYLTRVLGPGPIGMYAYVYALAALVGMLGYLSLDGVVIRELVTTDREKHGEIIGTAIMLRMIGYLVAAILIVGYSALQREHSGTEIALFASAALFLVGQPVSMVLTLWFRAQSNLRTPSAANLSVTFAGGGLKITALFLGLGVVAIGFTQTLAAFLASGALLAVFLRHGGPSLRNWSVSWPRGLEMLRECWKLQVGALLGTLYLQIDIPMLRLLAGPEVVGEYAVAARLVAMTLIFSAGVAMTAYPAMIRARAEGPEAYARLLRLAFSVVTLGAYLGILGNALFGQWILDRLVGDRFEHTSLLVTLLLLTLPLAFTRALVSQWVTLNGRGNFLIWSEGLGALTVVGLNLILIPRLGGTGAAISMLAAYVVSSVGAKIIAPDTRWLLMIQLKSLIDPVSPVIRLLASHRAAARRSSMAAPAQPALASSGTEGLVPGTEAGSLA